MEQQSDNTTPKRRTRNNARPAQLKQLFKDVYGDPANVTLLWENRAHYRGPIDSTPFRKWADRWMAFEAKRSQWLQQTLAQHRRVIMQAAEIALQKSFAKDYSITGEDVLCDVSWLLYQHARSFMRSDQTTTPKLSTRITGLVRWHVYIKYLKPRWANLKRVTSQVESGMSLGVEAYGGEELEEMAMLENAERYYSPQDAYGNRD